MIGVAPAFGDDRNLCAATAPQIGICNAGVDIEFLYRVGNAEVI